MGSFYGDQRLPSPSALSGPVRAESAHTATTELPFAKARLVKEIAALQRKQEVARYKLFKLVTEEVDRGRLVDFLDDRTDAIIRASENVAVAIDSLSKLEVGDGGVLGQSMPVINQLVKLQALPEEIRTRFNRGEVAQALAVMKSVLSGMPKALTEFKLVQRVVEETRTIAHQRIDSLVVQIETDFQSFDRSVIALREVSGCLAEFDSGRLVHRILSVRDQCVVASVVEGGPIEGIRQLTHNTSQLLKWSFPGCSSQIEGREKELWRTNIPGAVFSSIPMIDEFDSKTAEFERIFTSDTRPSYAEAVKRALALSVAELLRGVTDESVAKTASAVSTVCANRLVALSGNPRAQEPLAESVNWFADAVSGALHSVANERGEWEKIGTLYRLEYFLRENSFPALHRLAAPEMLTEVHLSESACVSRVWTILVKRFVQALVLNGDQLTPQFLEEQVGKLESLSGMKIVDVKKRLSAVPSVAELALAGSARDLQATTRKTRIGSESLLVGILWDVLFLALVEDFRARAVTVEERERIFSFGESLLELFPYPGVLAIVTQVLVEADLRLLGE